MPIKIVKPDVVTINPVAVEVSVGSALASALTNGAKHEPLPPGPAQPSPKKAKPYPRKQVDPEGTRQLGCKSRKTRARRRLLKADYEVGYCKPPQATRFVKGKSGNPRGRPPSCLRKARAVGLMHVLMNELEAPITIMEGGRPKKISKQRAIIKNLVKCAIEGSAGAIAKLFKLVREHRINLNDARDMVNVLKERYFFLKDVIGSDTSRMSQSEITEIGYWHLEYWRQPVSYLTGKLRLPSDHPANRRTPAKMRPSISIADDLLFELRERIPIKEGRKKFAITKLEALMKSLLNQAILGNDRAFSLVLMLFREYDWHKEDNSVVKLPVDSNLLDPVRALIEDVSRNPEAYGVPSADQEED